MIYSDVMTFEAVMELLLRNVSDDVDKREGSIIYDALAPAADALVEMYRELDVVMDETFVDTASLQFLLKRCAEKGIPVDPATSAVVRGEFTPSDLEIEPGTVFSCEDQNYSVTEKIEDGAYRLSAQTAGSEGNRSTGILIPVNTVSGLGSAEITALLIPGEDADNADTLREKYFASIDAEAFGGNQADYKQRINALDGVGGNKITPVWNGGGTVKVTIIDSEFSQPSQELIDYVQAETDPPEHHGEGVGFAPIGHVVTIVGVETTEINVSMSLTFTSGWSWSTAENIIHEVIEEYLSELCRDWENSANTIVRISHIENRVLSCEPILDIEGVTINGESSNLQLDAGNIPVLGTVTHT